VIETPSLPGLPIYDAPATAKIEVCGLLPKDTKVGGCVLSRKRYEGGLFPAVYLQRFTLIGVCSDLTEATLAGASISVAAALFIVFLLTAVCIAVIPILP
jgi:hypothetical protein